MMPDRLLSFIATAEDLRRHQTTGVRWWEAEDWAVASKAYSGMWPGKEFWPEEEWQSLYAEGYRYCGLIRNGRSLAIAGLWPRDEQEWEVIAVATAPAHRNCGHGKAVVTFVAEKILAEGRHPTITTRHDNVPMLRLIEQLAFKPKRKGEKVAATDG